MAPAEYVQFDIALPNARASMAERGILTIVALGSSTTQGACRKSRYRITRAVSRMNSPAGSPTSRSAC